MATPRKRCCSWKNCTTPTHTTTHRFCYKHTKGARTNRTKLCIMEDCKKQRAYSGKLCFMHNQRRHRHGDPATKKRSMFPKGQKRIPTYVGLTEIEWGQLAELADELNMTKSDWIRALILDELEDHYGSGTRPPRD